MEGYTIDVHRTLAQAPDTTSEAPPTGEYATGSYSPNRGSHDDPVRGLMPAFTPTMARMPLTITPEEIATLTKSPREDEAKSVEKKLDEPKSAPKPKGDSSPSRESEKTGNKRKRGDQSAAEVGSIMEDMRQTGVPDGTTANTDNNQQRPLGEGEAAFLSLVMQAANSAPIDDMSVEPTASLPDQLLESFIVRAHAMKDSSSSSDDGLSSGGKKRKFAEEDDADALDDDKKEHGLEVLRKGRSDALDGLSSLSREGSWSDNDDDDDVKELKQVYTAEGDSDRTMTDANPSASKRRPGRPPKKAMTVAKLDRDHNSENGNMRLEDWNQAEAVKRPQRRGPGRPPKKQASGGSEELFSFNEESLEGEKGGERGRGVGGRGVGIADKYERGLDDEASTMTLASSDDSGFLSRQRRRYVQTRRNGLRSGDAESLKGKEEEPEFASGNDRPFKNEFNLDDEDYEAAMRDQIADEWDSDQEDEEEEEEEDEEDDWHDDDEDESWVEWDGSSDGEGEVEVTAEEDEEEAAVVAELKAAEEIRAVADVMRREEEDLRKAIAASMAMAENTSMSDHQMVLSASLSEQEPEIAPVKVEPWVPAKTETPLTLRRLRPPWLDAFQVFQARGVSLEECRAEVEHTWQAFLAEGTNKRAWTKVPPTVTTWEDIVEYVEERTREAEEVEDRERKERREKRKKDLEQLAEDAKRARQEEGDNAEEAEEDNEEAENGEGEEDGDNDEESDDGDEESDGDGDEDDNDGDGRRRSLYQRRTRTSSRKSGGRRKKKRDMVAQLLDCFKEKDLNKVLVVDAAARKRKPPRKYGIDEWYNRRG